MVLIGNLFKHTFVSLKFKNMKKLTYLLFLILFTQVTFAQKSPLDVYAVKPTYRDPLMIIYYNGYYNKNFDGNINSGLHGIGVMYHLKDISNVSVMFNYKLKYKNVGIVRFVSNDKTNIAECRLIDAELQYKIFKLN